MVLKNPIKKDARLKLIDRKYCSCLQKVRTSQYKKHPSAYKKSKKLAQKNIINSTLPVYSEYAICNRSVYHTRGLSRDYLVNCSDNYNFNDMPHFALQSYAIDKNMKLTGKTGRMLTKKQLLAAIKRKVKAEASKRLKTKKQIRKNKKLNNVVNK